MSKIKLYAPVEEPEDPDPVLPKCSAIGPNPDPLH